MRLDGRARLALFSLAVGVSAVLLGAGLAGSAAAQATCPSGQLLVQVGAGGPLQCVALGSSLAGSVSLGCPPGQVPVLTGAVINGGVLTSVTSVSCVSNVNNNVNSNSNLNNNTNNNTNTNTNTNTNINTNVNNNFNINDNTSRNIVTNIPANANVAIARNVPASQVTGSGRVQPAPSGGFLARTGFGPGPMLFIALLGLILGVVFRLGSRVLAVETGDDPALLRSTASVRAPVRMTNGVPLQWGPAQILKAIFGAVVTLPLVVLESFRPSPGFGYRAIAPWWHERRLGLTTLEWLWLGIGAIVLGAGIALMG